MRPLIRSLCLTLAACSSTGFAQHADPVSFLNAEKGVPANLPFSTAVQVHDTLYLSGQLGNVPKEMKLVAGGIKAEARQALDNIHTTLKTYGYGMRNLVKCTVMLADMADWPAFNEIYKTYFDHQFPARSAFAVKALALEARVEIECIATKRD